MPADDYTTVPSTGKLKLKGVTDGRIDKKKKKKKPRSESESEAGTAAPNKQEEKSTAEAATAKEDDFRDNSVMLRTLAEEDEQITKDNRREASLVDGRAIAPSTAGEGEKMADVRDQLRTDAERRFEEQRRKRLEERLKREGVKTHKQRVEELNKYLSGLSEHHDMPKIGPG